MKTSGEVDGRELRGASFPRGPVTPQATFSPARRGGGAPLHTGPPIFAESEGPLWRPARREPALRLVFACLDAVRAAVATGGGVREEAQVGHAARKTVSGAAGPARSPVDRREHADLVHGRLR